MLKIGDFSKLACVSVKALRHYARLGLLRPVWTDRYTGYRYYSLEQLPRLNRILALKDLGFSLGQVGELLDEELSFERLRQLFNLKQAELHQQLLGEQARLDRVARRLQQIEQEGRLPAYDVTLKSVPAQPVASLRTRVPLPDDLPACFREAQGRIEAHIRQACLRPLGQWIAVYHDSAYSERNLDVEVALTLEMGRLAGARRVERPSEAVHVGMLPAVDTMASLLNEAPAGAESAASAQAILLAWTQRNGYRIQGPLRQVLLEDPGFRGQAGPQVAARAFTEVQLPVVSRIVYKYKLLAILNRKEADMEPEFVRRPAFKIVGMRYFGKNENQEISALWQQADPRMAEIHNAVGGAAYGVCQMDPSLGTGEFEYVAGLEVSEAENVPEGMVVRELPAARYAVFTHVGPLDKLRATYDYIYGTWFPQSGYEPTGDLDFELYNEEFKDFAPDSKFYIFVRMKEKD